MAPTPQQVTCPHQHWTRERVPAMTDPGEPPYELSTGDQVCSACGLVVWSDAVEHYLTARQKLYLHS